MTENNFDKLKDAICELVNLAEDATSRDVFEMLDNAGADVIDCLDKLSGYEAIGTIEEFKALKENQRKCEDCAGCTEWKCDCANERANAIDEFTERLQENVESFQAEINGFKADILTLDYFFEIIDEIAEELKGKSV